MNVSRHGRYGSILLLRKILVVEELDPKDCCIHVGGYLQTHRDRCQGRFSTKTKYDPFPGGPSKPLGLRALTRQK